MLATIRVKLRLFLFPPDCTEWKPDSQIALENIHSILHGIFYVNLHFLEIHMRFVFVICLK